MALRKNFRLIFSCEHGGHSIPPDYQLLFKNKLSVLKSHRGWDAGALGLARHLSSSLESPLVFSDISRLLVDLNRSLHHKNLFSEFTRDLDSKTKEQIIREYYFPYRNDLERWIRNRIKAGSPMMHFSIHSFAPNLGRKTRKADIGLLYDPSRFEERTSCIRLQSLLKQIAPRLRVRRNYPYLGTADGLTTYLRKQFDGNNYCGIEIEVNQRHVSGKLWREIRHTIVTAVNKLENEYRHGHNI